MDDNPYRSPTASETLSTTRPKLWRRRFVGSLMVAIASFVLIVLVAMNRPPLTHTAEAVSLRWWMTLALMTLNLAMWFSVVTAAISAVGWAVSSRRSRPN